jgi:hypothetical protein
MLIQGPLTAGMKLNARNVTTLRLGGTTPEDLAAVDGLAPDVCDLEVGQVDFEEPMDDGSGPMWIQEEAMFFPNIHIPPDPARFASLQRLQAHLDAESLVILGSFALMLPSLRRLGTIEVIPEEIGARCEWLPKGLEECVLAVVGDDVRLGVGSECLSQLRAAPKLNCSCLHLCFAPNLDADQLFFQLIAEVYGFNGSMAKSAGLACMSVRNPPAESTPLDRPVACS